MNKRKPKRCAVCSAEFMPYQSMMKVCSVPCAMKYAKDKEEEKAKKEWKKETRRRKEELKTRSDWLDEAEDAVRRYTRARDRLFYQKQGRLPECISCGCNDPSIQYAAGHLKTKGSHPEFRLDLNNINLQCNRRCNSELSGNITGTKDTHGYLKGLEIKYGKEHAEWVIDYLNTYKPLPNWTIDQLKEIKQGFNQWARELEKEIEGCGD